MTEKAVIALFAPALTVQLKSWSVGWPALSTALKLWLAPTNSAVDPSLVRSVVTPVQVRVVVPLDKLLPATSSALVRFAALGMVWAQDATCPLVVISGYLPGASMRSVRPQLTNTPDRLQVLPAPSAFTSASWLGT